MQDARYNSRIFQKVFMAHPFAASQRMVELCRMYDSHAPLLLYYSSSLLPLLQEIVLFEIIRFLLLSEVRFGCCFFSFLGDFPKFLSLVATQTCIVSCCVSVS